MYQYLFTYMIKIKYYSLLKLDEIFDKQEHFIKIFDKTLQKYRHVAQI